MMAGSSKACLSRLGLSLSIGLLLFWTSSSTQAQNQTASTDVVSEVQPKMVKIFGAGGLNRLEAWQSGFIVSNDGLIVTVWSYVLDQEKTTVVLDDGQKLMAKLVGFHPEFEIALLKVDSPTPDHFNLDAAEQAMVGGTAWAFSNLYGVATGNEKCSVQRGVVSAVANLEARRGNRRINYKGPAIFTDAITNNPGAAGGAITDQKGRLLGLIGRESKGANTNLWMNYAMPAEQISIAIDLILAGRSQEQRIDQMPTEPMTAELLGLMLVPDVVARTPPFVDQVVKGSAADRVGLQPDDLIVQVDGKVATSHSSFVDLLSAIDRDASISLTVQRGDKYLTFDLRANGQ